MQYNFVANEDHFLEILQGNETKNTQGPVLHETRAKTATPLVKPASPKTG